VFQHILVPVDFAEGSERTLDIALEVARLGNGKVSVLHVIELIKDTSFDEFEAFYTKLMLQAQEEMRALLLGCSGREVSSHIIYGQRVREIVHFASEQNVDLIVMRSHRIDPDDAARGWGTISYKVGILAPCPVMLVK
jgi:nucleotide-binding universal stress UspA family protein